MALLLALAAAGCGAGDERRDNPAPERTSSDFVGIYSDDVFFRDAAYKRRTLARQHEAGIRVIRQPFAWNEFEANPERYDAFVRAAADAGIRVLPVLVGPEPGAQPADDGMRPPHDAEAYGEFAAAVARRYGPGGSVRTRLPIRSWQIWNEPNIPSWWGTGPDPEGYTEILRAASEAIRRVDRDAEIVAAGVPESRLGIPGPRFLERVYAAGGGDAIDTVAAHAYAETPAEVAERVRAIRRVAPREDRLWVTEVGWGTGGRDGPLRVDPETQARYLTETFRRLGALRVRGVVWFQWRDPDPFPGRREIWPFFAGLLTHDGRPKPALAALERAAAQFAR